jgi:hypothetical protein
MSIRAIAVSMAFAVFFAILCFGSVLQDRLRKKAGISVTSLSGLWRVFGARELYLFGFLVLLMVVIATALIALDELGYFPK